MEENRKGPGIFYAVVGVATLVVAIIGATFAYFSATATSKEGDIQGTTAEAAGMSLVVTKVTDTNLNLIPLNLHTGDTDGVDTVDQYKPAMAGECKDANENNVCQVYKIALTNNSTTSTIQVRGTLTLNSDATNMKWQLLGINAVDSVITGLTAPAAFATTVGVGTAGDLTVAGNATDTLGTGPAAANKSLAAGASAYYYVVVWVEEMGKAQETADAKKNYSGTVNFSAVTAAGTNTGVTATFTE